MKSNHVPKIKRRFTWDPEANPNRISRFLIKKPDILAANPDKKPFPYLLLSFLIPFIGVGLVFLISSIYVSFQPSAHEGFQQSFSMLKSDAYHQYFPFFKDFRQKLLNGDSLLYAWNIGMGIDYLGLYSYYLGSPLNLFSVLIPEKWLIGYFTFLTPLRLGFASLFFALMLKKVFGKKDLSIALFGSFYATCAWSFGYSWNTMWLDTFALMPLVILGTIQLLNDRKYILYTVALFFSVVINYYIGFFVCIFTLLVFICYQVCRWKNFKKFAADLGLMALFTVLALGATAIITLPTYASLLTTNAGTHIDLAAKTSLNATGSATAATTAAATAPSSSFKLNMTDRETLAGFGSFSNWIALLQGMINVGTNVFSFAIPNSIETEGLPNIYCGLFASIFVLLYITCRQIRRRERICGLLLLLFLNMSFVIDALNYIWHGFHDTNMIPYRFSFIYSFVMLFMAYRVWILRNRIRTWQVITAGSVLLISLFVSREFADFIDVFRGGLSLGALLKTNTFFPFVNLALLAAYLVALLCISFRKPVPTEQRAVWFKKLRFRRSLGSFLLVTVICGELLLNIVFFAVANNHYVDVANYPQGTTHAAAVIDHMKQNDDSLYYRAETTYTHTMNDSALNGYNGITTFTSSANASVTRYMRFLGYGALENWNRYAYEDSSPMNTMFLNLKYMIERKGLRENPYFTPVYQSGDVHLLKNNYYLPLGFMVDPQLSQMQFSNMERFAFQNKFLSAALGEEVAPWKPVDGDTVKISTSDGVTVHQIAEGEKSICKASTAEQSGYVDFVYTIDQEAFMNLAFNIIRPASISNNYQPKIRIYIDRGEGLSQEPLIDESYTITYTLAVGQVHPGDKVHVVIDCCKNLPQTTFNVWAAFLDQDVMDYAHEKLSQNTLKLTQFEDTQVSGTIQCDKAGLLYTSIPQNSNYWHAYVDGKPAQIKLIGNAMIGVMLDEGTHTVTFRYENKAFQIGTIVSIGCAVLFGGIVLTDLILRKKRKKADQA